MKKFSDKYSYVVGVIADTHGVLPLSAPTAFKDADIIIHAGDIGKPEILASLQNIAPTIGVRGNMDMGSWADRLAEQEIITISQSTLCILHDAGRIAFNPDERRYQAIISGHTHRPLVARHRGVLHINPGSAVQPRYGYPPSVALLHIQGRSVEARLIELSP